LEHQFHQIINALANYYEHRVSIIENVISKISFVSKLTSIKENNLIISGKVEISFEELHTPLDFEFKIYPQYPLKSYDSESIKFYNKNLIKYNHIMTDGAICIHTSFHTNLERKIVIDFSSLKYWIIKYYINKDNDEKYEHITFSKEPINDKYYSYIFTDLLHNFSKNDFGKVQIASLNNGLYNEKLTNNFILQNCITANNERIECQWSSPYKDNTNSSSGFYIFIQEHPAKYQSVIFENWLEFNNLFPENFIRLLFQFQEEKLEKSKGSLIPLFIGYNTIGNEIHWQVAMLEIGKFPIEKSYLMKNRLYFEIEKMIDQKINWAITYNSSYHYFFGRGILDDRLINGKILIIGVGAIGSIIAKTLVRGGVKDISLADYDIKEPDNVCRSEYFFNLGLNSKVHELAQVLTSISPFVNIDTFKNESFESIIKTFYKEPKANHDFVTLLNEFNIVFDCTTDNNLMYILNTLELNCDLINISITNKANNLVCAFYPNIFNFVTTQFENVLVNDVTDLYEPTGCWSPTFKASYNDINVLVQTAIMHINKLYQSENNKNNFIVTPNNLGVEIVEY